MSTYDLPTDIAVDDVLENACHLNRCDHCGGFQAFGEFPEQQVRQYMEQIDYADTTAVFSECQNVFEQARHGCACQQLAENQ